MRRIGGLLSGVLLFTLLGSLALHALTARESLRAQLQACSDDGATMLAQALALPLQKGDPALMQQIAAAQLDTGHYRRVRLLRSDGAVHFEREMPVHRGSAPAWFSGLLPIESGRGLASLSDGRRPVGTLELWSQTAWASDQLWAGCVRIAGALLLIGAAAALLAAWAVQGWRRAFEVAVGQAEALQERRFVLVDESPVPELGRLARAMNTLVRHMQDLFDAQAAQLEALRERAQSDPVTGLSARPVFMSQLAAAMHGADARGGGLLIVRLCRLQAMNQRIGHAAADRLLAALAQVLQSYPQRVRGALAGRLNGADFALYLPAAGVIGETAFSLAEALRIALVAIDREADLRLGAVELAHGMAAEAALSLADEALARAECREPFAVDLAEAPSPALGESQWRSRLSGALDMGRTELAQFAVRNAGGALLHLDCPMRLQLEPGGVYAPAAHWLAMAVRCRQAARIDLAAIDLALAAVHRDGVPRGVNVAAASLITVGFIAEVQQRLGAAPQQSRKLSIDLAESAVAQQLARVREASARWRGLGVRLGLEHGGAGLRSLSRLHELGLDYVKLDRSCVRGVARDAMLRELARGLVALLHGMHMQVLAEGVDDSEDLAALWALGFDGATGPAVPGLG